MKATSHQFPDLAQKGMTDPNMQKATALITSGKSFNRKRAVETFPAFDATKADAIAIKNHVLDHLADYLEEFAQNVEASGGHIHFATDSANACQIITDIALAEKAKLITKGKSMISEEISLNTALEAHGFTVRETDLGEYIIQLANEPPSHIIGPALHKTKEQVADLFKEFHGEQTNYDRSNAEGLVKEARARLRDDFLSADIGITGANFLIADSGSTVIVTNEGNGDLTQLLPNTHIVISSIDKVIPSLNHLPTFLRLLGRSATGQTMSSYTTLSTGPRRQVDPDGPQNFHVVLVDNGRSQLLHSDKREVLCCIRCGACMNHCPVYAAVGGHAYGWVYPGPIGAVLDPHFIGLKEAHHLPEASSFCGRCEEVCPMQIPLPKIMRHWREESHSQAISPATPRALLALWGWVARRPTLYKIAMKLARWGLRHLPFLAPKQKDRRLQEPAATSFMESIKKQGKDTPHA